MERLTNSELRAARKIIGLSGQELANRLGVRPDTVRRWESGRDEIPFRVREELVTIADDRATTIHMAGRALETGTALPLTPETIVESKGWRGSLQELQDWLWDGNHIIEANLLARLRDEGRIPTTDDEDDQTAFLDVLPALTMQDIKDVLDDPRATLRQ